MEVGKQGRSALVLLGVSTYLHIVHLELADDLDGHLSSISLKILCPVNVTEGAVAHLLQQLPPLQARIFRVLALFLILFGNNLGNVVVGNASIRLGLGGRQCLVGLDIVSCGIIGLCNVMVAGCGGGRVGIWDGGMGMTWRW